MRHSFPLIFLFGCTTIDTTLVKGTDDSGCASPVRVYEDRDADGVGAGAGVEICGEPEAGWVSSGEDCDDNDASVFPGAAELCDLADQDCDGDIDEGLDTLLYFPDADGDSYGDVNLGVEACMPPDGYVEDPRDCDDTNPAINPDGAEVCNGLDDDCNGTVDDNASDMSTWYADEDQDGHGVASPTLDACTQPEGWSATFDDCDDTDPGLWESCTNDPATASAVCGGYPLYTWADTQPSNPELNIIGAYESDGGHGNPPGVTNVHIERRSQMTLVLSSYEPVDWQVTAASGAVINEIILAGYNNHLATVPSGVPVTDLSGGTRLGACGYSLPYNGGGCDTNIYISTTEAYTNMTMSSFTGCYHMTDVTLY